MKDLNNMKDIVDGGKKDGNGFLKLDLDKIKIKTEAIKDHYDVEHSPFARGKFATVRKCTNKETGIDYAAKFIRKRRRAVDVRHEILHEIAVLELTSPCPQIVNLIDVYETNSELILVLELVAGGELQRVIDEEEVISEENVILLMRQILKGVSFLHDNKIAHLDIKPQNILLTGSFPDCNLKLCDFGISRVVCGDVEIREIVGTPDYIAPEVLHYEPISVETDMWSIGILVYVLLSGHSPFGGETKQETFCNITQSDLEFPSELFCNISSKAKKFIRSVLVRDPKLRPSVKECLKHPWLCQDAADDVYVDPVVTSCSVPSLPSSPSSYSSSPPQESGIDGSAPDLALSSATSSMDGSVVDSDDPSNCSSADMDTVNNSTSTVNDSTSTINDSSSTVNNSTSSDSVVDAESAPISCGASAAVREIIDISPNKSNGSPMIESELQSPRRSPEREVPSPQQSDRLRRSCSTDGDNPDRKSGLKYHHDNKENIRLTRTRVAPPPIIHSLSPSLNVRSGFVRSAITGFTSGRSMSTLGPGKSLTSLLSPTKTRASSVSGRTTAFSSTFVSSGSRSCTSSRKIKISSEETELRISKRSVVVIDEGVCF